MDSTMLDNKSYRSNKKKSIKATDNISEKNRYNFVLESNFINKNTFDNISNHKKDNENISRNRRNFDIQPIEGEYTFYHPKSDIDLSHLSEKTLGNKLLEREDIKLLTYNLFLRPPLVKNNENDWKEERLDDFLKLLHNFDIICLQEVFGACNSRKLFLIRAAIKNGFFFYIDFTAPSFYNKYMSDGGIIVLSRFPVVKFSTHVYNYGVVSDSMAQKGIIYCQIEIKGSKLHLFNTHTQASYNNDLPELFVASFNTRMDQIKQLGSFINEILSNEMDQENDICLLCGDLNVDALKYHLVKIVSIFYFLEK